MKIILSRKGFDAENGGYSSPIMPDGTLISLPIPGKKDDDGKEKEKICYSDLELDDGVTYYDLMKQLKANIKLQTEKHGKFKWVQLTKETRCHCDPDIYSRILPRMSGWRGALGQGNKAQKHLEKQKVQKGDVFLFYGRFKKVVEDQGKFTFDKSSHSKHVIFGYLQISEIVLCTESEKGRLLKKYPWLEKHPHITHTGKDSSNTIYVAPECLSWKLELKGYGTFRLDKNLILTGSRFSNLCMWDLPPVFRKVKISYNPNSWKDGYFQAAKRGQEFVVEENGEIENWTKALINNNALR